MLCTPISCLCTIPPFHATHTMSAKATISVLRRQALPSRGLHASSSALRTAPPAHKTLSPLESPRQHLLSELQKRDYPSYLGYYFYPKELQTHYLALRCFNAELASLKDTVSNELLGRMRMGWWREAVRGAFENRPAKHPVVLALRDAIHDPAAGPLLEDHFMRIIQIREDDLAASLAPPTLEELETYSEGTSSRLNYLALNLLNVSDPNLDELFSHLGKASGLALSISSIPYHSHPPPAARNSVTRGARKLIVPSEFLQESGVTEEDVYRNGPEANGFRDAVFKLATRANDYIITARTLINQDFGGKIPQRAVGPLVNAVCHPSVFCRMSDSDPHQTDSCTLLPRAP